MVVYVPSKRRIKLPDIPGIINAVTAMKPEKNKYKRFISTNSLEGKRYRKLQIQIERVNPNKNRADILGFSGSKKAEHSKMLDYKDLIINGYSSMKNNMREEKMKIEVNIPKTNVIKKVPFISFQNTEILKVKSNFNVFVLIDFIESINSSNNGK